MKPSSPFYRERQVMQGLEPFLNLFFGFFWVTWLVMWLAGFVRPFSALTWAGIGAGIVGWLIMAIAKWPQIKRLDLFTFGVVGLPVLNRRLYLISYLALAVAMGLLVASHFTNFMDMDISRQW